MDMLNYDIHYPIHTPNILSDTTLLGFAFVVYGTSKMLERIDFQSLGKQVAFEGCNNGEIDMVRMSNVIRYLRAKGNPTS